MLGCSPNNVHPTTVQAIFRKRWSSSCGAPALVLLSVGALIGGAGCKSRQESPQLSDLVSFAAAIADLTCQSRAACCERADIAFDATECREEVIAELPAALEKDSPNGTYDPKLAEACLTAVKLRTTCGDVDDSGGAIEACEHVLHGKLAPGAPCQTTDECNVGAGQNVWCTSDGGENEEDRVCVVSKHEPAQHGELGDECRRTCDGDCFVSWSPKPARFTVHGGNVGCYRADGLRCAVVESDDGEAVERCIELVELGEECFSDPDCVEGAFCGGGSVPAVCTPLFENGADCFADPIGCRSGYCDEETWQCGEPVFAASECTDEP